MQFVDHATWVANGRVGRSVGGTEPELHEVELREQRYPTAGLRTQLVITSETSFTDYSNITAFAATVDRDGIECLVTLDADETQAPVVALFDVSNADQTTAVSQADLVKSDGSSDMSARAITPASRAQSFSFQYVESALRSHTLSLKLSFGDDTSVVTPLAQWSSSFDGTGRLERDGELWDGNLPVAVDSDAHTYTVHLPQSLLHLPLASFQFVSFVRSGDENEDDEITFTGVAVTTIVEGDQELETATFVTERVGSTNQWSLRLANLRPVIGSVIELRATNYLYTPGVTAPRLTVGTGLKPLLLLNPHPDTGSTGALLTDPFLVLDTQTFADPAATVLDYEQELEVVRRDVTVEFYDELGYASETAAPSWDTVGTTQTGNRFKFEYRVTNSEGLTSEPVYRYVDVVSTYFDVQPLEVIYSSTTDYEVNVRVSWDTYSGAQLLLTVAEDGENKVTGIDVLAQTTYDYTVTRASRVGPVRVRFTFTVDTPDPFATETVVLPTTKAPHELPTDIASLNPATHLLGDANLNTDERRDDFAARCVAACLKLQVPSLTLTGDQLTVAVRELVPDTSVGQQYDTIVMHNLFTNPTIDPSEQHLLIMLERDSATFGATHRLEMNQVTRVADSDVQTLPRIISSDLVASPLGSRMVQLRHVVQPVITSITRNETNLVIGFATDSHTDEIQSVVADVTRVDNLGDILDSSDELTAAPFSTISMSDPNTNGVSHPVRLRVTYATPAVGTGATQERVFTTGRLNLVRAFGDINTVSTGQNRPIVVSGPTGSSFDWSLATAAGEEIASATNQTLGQDVNVNLSTSVTEDGTYDLRIASAGLMSHVHTIRRDTVRPTAEFLDLPGRVGAEVSVNIVVRASEPLLAAPEISSTLTGPLTLVAMTDDDITWQLSGYSSPDTGSETLTLRATFSDAAGNTTAQSTTNHTLTVDASLPRVELEAGFAITPATATSWAATVSTDEDDGTVLHSVFDPDTVLSVILTVTDEGSFQLQPSTVRSYNEVRITNQSGSSVEIRDAATDTILTYTNSDNVLTLPAGFQGPASLRITDTNDATRTATLTRVDHLEEQVVVNGGAATLAYADHFPQLYEYISTGSVDLRLEMSNGINTTTENVSVAVDTGSITVVSHGDLLRPASVASDDISIAVSSSITTSDLEVAWWALPMNTAETTGVRSTDFLAKPGDDVTELNLGSSRTVALSGADLAEYTDHLIVAQLDITSQRVQIIYKQKTTAPDVASLEYKVGDEAFRGWDQPTWSTGTLYLQITLDQPATTTFTGTIVQGSETTNVPTTLQVESTSFETGAATLYLTLTDHVGNVATKNYAFAVDRDVPTVSFDLSGIVGSDGFLFRSEVTGALNLSVSVAGVDTTDDTVTVSLNDGTSRSATYVSGSDWSFQLTQVELETITSAASAGSHVLTFVATRVPENLVTTRTFTFETFHALQLTFDTSSPLLDGNINVADTQASQTVGATVTAPEGYGRAAVRLRIVRQDTEAELYNQVDETQTSSPTFTVPASTWNSVPHGTSIGFTLSMTGAEPVTLDREIDLLTLSLTFGTDDRLFARIEDNDVYNSSNTTGQTQIITASLALTEPPTATVDGYPTFTASKVDNDPTRWRFDLSSLQDGEYDVTINATAT